ncbi:Flagellar hook-associated protein flgK [Vibrio chagasii]|nr:Flagellar hook-associated protein flgK [Vibrio chagasii]
MRIDTLNSSAHALGQMQYATSIASQNINNAANPYYTRQAVMFSTNSAGVLTASPIRMSNAFLNQQLHSSTGDLGHHGALYNMARSVDSIITGISSDADGNSTNALQQALTSINESLVNLAAEDNVAGRSTFLSRLDSLFTTGQTMLSQLDEYKEKLEDDLKVYSVKVNESAEQLAKINEQLRKNPNDHSLLTQRDQLIGELSEYINVNVEENDNGSVIVRVGSGHELVNGGDFTELDHQVDADGKSHIYLHGVNITNNPSRIGGLIGGTVEAYTDVVSESEIMLSKLLVGFAAAINDVNGQGYTASGEAGGNLINIPSYTSGGMSGNQGNGSLNISIDYENFKNMSSGPFSMQVTDDGYEFFDTSTGETVVVDSFPAEVFGFTIDGDGDFQVGDKFEFNPLPQFAKGLEVIGSHEDIAAAGSLPVTDGDNENLLRLVDVMSDSIFGNNSVMDELGDMFVIIGNKANSTEHAYKTASSINEQAEAEWANYSAVSTQEEELNILKYQQIYQSVSKVIQTNKQMFDTLFNSI